MARKACTTVYLEQEQLDRLKRLSESTRVPMAEYVREALEELLARHEQGPSAGALLPAGILGHT